MNPNVSALKRFRRNRNSPASPAKYRASPSIVCSMLRPLPFSVISHPHSLNRPIAFGAILRFSPFPLVKLHPKNFPPAVFPPPFPLVPLEPQLVGDESLRAFYHPLPR